MTAGELSASERRVLKRLVDGPRPLGPRTDAERVHAGACGALERRGLVTIRAKGNVRLVRITPEGRAALVDVAAEGAANRPRFDDIASAPPTPEAAHAVCAVPMADHGTACARCPHSGSACSTTRPRSTRPGTW